MSSPGYDRGARHFVGETYVWPYVDDPHKVQERGRFKNTKDYARAGLANLPLPQPSENGHFSSNAMETIGLHKIIHIIFAHPIFQLKLDDTFVLRHDDLDLQNILTDSDGNITGIIDWDGSLAMPRSIGTAAVPVFLRRDWFPNSSLSRRPHMGWRYDQYRQIYAAAMVDAGNEDAQYTIKSAIYQAAFAALYEGGDLDDFVNRLLLEIPDFRMEPLELKLHLVSGWTAAKEILEYELDKVLKPEMPTMTWGDVEADLAAHEWMAAFGDIVEED
jgi:hypothetical protein